MALDNAILKRPAICLGLPIFSFVKDWKNAFSEELALIRRLATDREKICNELNVPVTTGKEIFFVTMNGARLPQEFEV